jgi:hypothetical protein
MEEATKGPLEGKSDGVQRTEINCHSCHKNFVAELDFGINGNFIIECAHCAHEHFRTIKDGVITEGRWGSGNDSTTRIAGRSVWKSSVIKAQTSTVVHFLRDRWLNRSDYNGR